MALAPFITTQDLSDRLGRDVTADNGAISAVDSAMPSMMPTANADAPSVVTMNNGSRL